MNKLHKRRLWILAFFSTGITIACALIGFALKQNINVFVTPTEALQAQPEKPMRLGGMDKQKSLKREPAGLKLNFVVTDFHREINVFYEGILPDLFREGKGVVAEGKMGKNGIFMAKTILAKHDENYSPKMNRAKDLKA